MCWPFHTQSCVSHVNTNLIDNSIHQRIRWSVHRLFTIFAPPTIIYQLNFFFHFSIIHQYFVYVCVPIFVWYCVYVVLCGFIIIFFLEDQANIVQKYLKQRKQQQKIYVSFFGFVHAYITTVWAMIQRRAITDSPNTINSRQLSIQSKCVVNVSLHTNY